MPLNAIKTRVLDILYQDARLMAPGTAFATGWMGATRERFGVVEDAALAPIPGAPYPQQYFVNLFDRGYAKDSLSAKPGVYTGLPMLEVSDEEEHRSASALSVLNEFRRMLIPLVISCVDQNYYAAQDQRDQLRYNIKLILADHIIDNMWYNLRMPGKSGGGELQERDWTTGSGEHNQGINEAVCVMPIAISYQWSKFTTLA